MKRILIAAVALLTVTAANAEHADEYSLEAPVEAYNAIFNACQEANPRGGAGEKACIQKALADAERDLNRVYQSRFSYLQDSAKARAGLIAAERAWVTSRELDCTFAGKTDVYPYCMLEGAIARRYWLMRNIGD